MAGIVKKVIKKIKNDAKIRKTNNARDVASKQVKNKNVAGSKKSDASTTRLVSEKSIGKMTSTRTTPTPRLEGQTKRVSNKSTKGNKSAQNKTALKAWQPDARGKAPLGTKEAMTKPKEVTPSAMEYERGCAKPAKSRKLKNIGKGK